MRIGIVGCGHMGGGMVRRLLELGRQVTCHDLDAAVREAMRAAGAGIAPSIARLATDSDVLLLSLPTAAVVESVMCEAHPGLRAGSVVIDLSTSRPATTRALASAARDAGYAFLDAPVSGGPSAARSGAMTMLVGGDADALDAVRPLLDRLAARIVHVGDAGAGHAAKIANNLLCAANLVLVSEAVRLGEASGVPAAQLLEGINAGSGRSAVSEVNYPRWVLNDAFDSGFTMGLMRKDVRLALELARDGDVALPGFEGIAALWADSIDRLDDGADFNRITAMAGEDR